MATTAPEDPASPTPPPPTGDASAVNPARDPRAIIIAVAGIVTILLVVLVVVLNLPGDVAANVKNTKGENAVAIASAAFTAISTMVTAYFGIKVANVAREETVKTGERHAAALERIAGSSNDSKTGA
jgi:amino acid permease